MFSFQFFALAALCLCASIRAQIRVSGCFKAKVDYSDCYKALNTFNTIDYDGRPYISYSKHDVTANCEKCSLKLIGGESKVYVRRQKVNATIEFLSSPDTGCVNQGGGGYAIISPEPGSTDGTKSLNFTMYSGSGKSCRIV